jgi:hypothetical protein
VSTRYLITYTGTYGDATRVRYGDGFDVLSSIKEVHGLLFRLVRCIVLRYSVNLQGSRLFEL